jgi:AraC-like DNA-binding protein
MATLTLDWLHVAILLGALQGVFLAGVLATKRRNRIANRLLAAATLAFSIALATSVYHAAGLVPVYPHLFGLSYPLPFLYGPLVYLYAISAADRNRRLNRRDALHFVPFAAVVIVGLPIYMMSGADKVSLYQRILSGDRPLLLVIADPLKYVSGVSYVVATILFLRRHRERVKESYSSTKRVNLRWLLWLGASAAAIWILAIAVDVLNSAGVIRVGLGDDLVSLAIAILVYLIGYFGLRQPEIFRYETAEYPVPVVAPTPRVEVEAHATVHAEVQPPRYERSGLTDSDAERLEQALLATMDAERPWQDSDLTLADLAHRLSTTPHKLSEVLNARVGQTFYDFVNGYRVREVQRRIAAHETRDANMLTIAMDAGFASKSTFNLVFKKMTGQTPSDFRQSTGSR